MEPYLLFYHYLQANLVTPEQLPAGCSDWHLHVVGAPAGLLQRGVRDELTASLGLLEYVQMERLGHVSVVFLVSFGIWLNLHRGFDSRILSEEPLHIPVVHMLRPAAQTWRKTRRGRARPLLPIAVRNQLSSIRPRNLPSWPEISSLVPRTSPCWNSYIRPLSSHPATRSQH